MLQVLQFLISNPVTNYKYVAKKLEINERYVRYDIDKLNEVLYLKKLPMIKKESKGVLKFIDHPETKYLFGKENFVFSQEDRIRILKLMLLLDSNQVKLNLLSNKLQVSRSTLKNDLKEVKDKLKKNKLELIYNRKFLIIGNGQEYKEVLCKELKQYIPLLIFDIKRETAFETYIKKFIISVYERIGIDIKSISKLIQDELTRNNQVLSDESYIWYFTNILLIIRGHKEFINETVLKSPKNSSLSVEVNTRLIESLSKATNIDFFEQEKQSICELLSYAKVYGNLRVQEDIMYVEAVVFQLMEKMTEKTAVNFHEDRILIDGLLNHIGPLIKRLHKKIDIGEKSFSYVVKEYNSFFNLVKEAVSQTDIINELSNESELAYITIHFLSSLKRLKSISMKRVLLVCGYGYGTSVILKETLMNEFQIQIVDVLPGYLLSNYSNWEEIDCVISTKEIPNVNLYIPQAIVSPILTQKDYEEIRKLGIEKKRVISHYYNIKQNLSFLNDNDRLRVLNVIKQEFGYQEPENKIVTFSHMLDTQRIKITSGYESWPNAVKDSCSLLSEKGFVDSEYGEQIIKDIKTLGSYSVQDKKFVLLHGRADKNVKKSGMSLIISKKPVHFEEKQTNIIICLSSKDNKEHIPAITSFVRMIKKTNLLNLLKTAKTPTEAMIMIKSCEVEICS